MSCVNLISLNIVKPSSWWVFATALWIHLRILFFHWSWREQAICRAHLDFTVSMLSTVSITSNICLNLSFGIGSMRYGCKYHYASPVGVVRRLVILIFLNQECSTRVGRPFGAIECYLYLSHKLKTLKTILHNTLYG